MTVSLPPVEGEIVDVEQAVEAVEKRHAVCGYVVRAAGYRGAFVPAMCGTQVLLPLPPRDPKQGEHCPTCLEASIEHAAHCGCFKLWPASSRLPR
jgi:hypothetical protein